MNIKKKYKKKNFLEIIFVRIIYLFIFTDRIPNGGEYK